MKVPTLQGIKKSFRSLAILIYAVREFIKDNCPRVAAALTYITLLSFVPVVAISLSMLSRFKTSQEAFLGFIFQYLIPTPSLQETIITNIKTFAQQTTTLSIFGGLFLIITAVSLLYTIEGTFNQVWGVTVRRPFVSKFTAFWSVITLSPILIAVALLLSLKLSKAPLVGSILKIAVIKGSIHYFLPFFLTFLAIFIIYRILPYTRVKVRPAIIGSLIATFLFQVARWGFEVYITEFAHFDKIYGMLGVLPMFFIWIYICWLVILLGGEVTYSVQNIRLETKSEKFTEDNYDAYHALRVMMAIGRSFLKGDGATSLDALAERLGIPYSLLVGILNRLREKGVVRSVDEGKVVYLPARSLDRITIQEVVEGVQGDPFRFPPPPYRGQDEKAIHRFFQEAQKGVQDILKGITIEVLLTC
ncbi:MAG: YihY family inner membrane protein [Deltaproteobacteria bacterium]|nr:YihY family inner membrane protein [Deltaproteobacteria bacterium]